MNDPLKAHDLADKYSKRSCFDTVDIQVVAFNAFYAGYMYRVGDDDHAESVARLKPIERLQDLNRMDALIEKFEEDDGADLLGP